MTLRSESVRDVRLSVVVAPTERGEFLEGALAALAVQSGVRPFEVIIPVDKSISGTEELRQAYPNVRFVDVRTDIPESALSNIGVAHVAIDRRRAGGLQAARGDVVALTEEHARPAPNWCATLLENHRASYAVIGGAIENARPRIVNWALYFMDAGRYQNPLPEGPSRFVSDVNVSYKRGQLEKVRALWENMYHETGVHDAIRAAGETLWLTPKLVVWQDRGKIGLKRALKERFAWARLYAGRRSREISGMARLAMVLGSPLLTFVLPARAGKTTFARGRHRGAFLMTLPMLLIMSSVWALGELTGYFTGRATKQSYELKPGPVRYD